MTGWEPHPLLELPTKAEAYAMGLEKLKRLILDRKNRLEKAEADPLRCGWPPPPRAEGVHDHIWHVADDLLCDGKKVMIIDPDGIDVPKEMIGRRELFIGGGNRPGKTEYAAKKCMRVLSETPTQRGWSFYHTGPKSAAKQQPLFWKYMPAEIRQRALANGGKFKEGTIGNFTWHQKGGFTEQTFVLPNASQHWFHNYEQDVENVEGEELDIAWLDEPKSVALLKTIRYRLGDRGGILLVTFTSKSEAFRALATEYEKGAETVLEVDAKFLPLRDEAGAVIPGKYEKVPRVCVAGPGSDGNQQANIIYFHITDNPFYGWQKNPKPGYRIMSPEARFGELIKDATREEILRRAYGILLRLANSQFPKFRDDVHVVVPDRIPREGTNYLIIDPCPGRNWFLTWLRALIEFDQLCLYIYREWPSYGHPRAYIPGHGMLGPWTVVSATGAADGDRGPAQTPSLGWGLDRYVQEIRRLEGHPEHGEPSNAPAPLVAERAPRFVPRNPLIGRMRGGLEVPARHTAGVEEIMERWIDSRYGATPQQQVERITTLIEQLEELGLSFKAAPGDKIDEGVQMINTFLDYDADLPIGKWSPRMARINRPRMYVSKECPNTIYSLREWTGIDGQAGAAKDPVDNLRMGVTADLRYVGPDAFSWKGGGTY